MKIRYYVYIDENRRKKSTGELPVCLVFYALGKTFKFNTGLYAKEKFNGREFPNNEPNAKIKNMRLTRLLAAVDEYLLLDEKLPLPELRSGLKELVTGRVDETKVKCFADYVMDFAATKVNAGTRGLYELTARKVAAYDARADFDTITADWLRKFERYNTENGMGVNGIAIHLRNIRTVFNWCIDNEWTEKYPFRRFKVKQEKVAIRNLTAAQIATLRDYPVEAWQRIYRDFFMLSFYLCGINPVDLLSLTKKNLVNGRLQYKRRKTGKIYDIPVPPEAVEIMERYKGKNYLLSPLDAYSDYKDFTHHWNDALKKIGRIEIVPDAVGKMRKMVYHPLFPTLTVYSARYSFASIGAELDIPRETIALCLGHSWADVTSHYIAYDIRKIDDAVRKIIDYVNSIKN